MRTLFLGICICIASTVMAQRECAVPVYLQQQLASDPALSSKINELENFIRLQPAAKMFGEDAKVIRIPVVVHVLYKTPAQNISDAQIQSQIDVLNKDFRRLNSDTSKTPDRFKPLAADIQIEFQLATADPQGRATSGIIRKATHVNEWDVNDKIKFSAHGGDDAWDSRYYLNIWIGNFSAVIGYSSVPGGAPEKDGIAIKPTAFGTINSKAPYHLGRTAVHEVGHWLGLKHIWGDTYCGDDLVDDTPKQGNFTPGCPTSFRSSCNNTATGDMYMNYMDYTSDACVNLFTHGQKQRMLAMFNTGGPRNKLLVSKGLSEPWNFTEPELPVESPVVSGSFRVYPNPSAGEMVVNFDANESWIGKTLSVMNVNGVVLSKIQVASTVQKLDLSQLKPGLYFVQGENGGQRVRQKFIRL